MYDELSNMIYNYDYTGLKDALKKSPAYIHATDFHDNTLLMKAVDYAIRCHTSHPSNSFTSKRDRNNSIKIIHLLLEYGADIDAKDDAHYTAVSIAIMHNDINIVRTLLSYNASLNINSKYDQLVFAEIENHNINMIKLLLDHDRNIIYYKDGEGRTALHTTAVWDYIDTYKCTKLYLQYGADVNNIDIYSNTPLINASGNGLFKIVKLLIKYGANINYINNHSRSALFFASQCGHTDIVKLLLKSGASLYLSQCNPLNEAIINNHINVIKLLLNMFMF